MRKLKKSKMIEKGKCLLGSLFPLWKTLCQKDAKKLKF